MSPTSPLVVAVAGDAGGAVAVGPVILAMRKERRFDVLPLAYRHAAAPWARLGIPSEVLYERLDAAGVDALLAAHRPVALLVGTSMNGIDLERCFTRIARARGIPTLAVLDMWSSYSARFGARAGEGPDVPDRIAVMDERARGAMLAEGFRAERVVVTGHPGFDDLVAERERFGPPERMRVRASLGAREGERLVLFASQPLAEAWGADTGAPGHPGYTERTVLDAMHASLERVAPHIPAPHVLVVRPHPREQPPVVDALAGSVRVVVSSAGSPREAAMAADAVLGMCTMLLVESALLGIPTLSIQPGLRQPDALPPMPDLPRVVRGADLDDALKRTLTSAPRARARADVALAGARPGEGGAAQTAAGRVAALVGALVSPELA